MIKNGNGVAICYEFPLHILPIHSHLELINYFIW